MLRETAEVLCIAFRRDAQLSQYKGAQCIMVIEKGNSDSEIQVRRMSIWERGLLASINNLHERGDRLLNSKQ